MQRLKQLGLPGFPAAGDEPRLVEAVPRYPLPAGEVPARRLCDLGVTALSSSECLALVLGGKPEVALAQAGRLLSAFGGLRGLRRASLSEIARTGIRPERAIALQAALDMGRRTVQESAVEGLTIRSPADAAALLLPEMGDLDQEQLRVLLLNTRHQVLRQVLIYQGSVNTALVRPAEVYREAVRDNCPAILLAHAHPSGCPEPSPEDLAITRDLIAVGKMLSVELVDHLVIGRNAFVSMRERHLPNNWA